MAYTNGPKISTTGLLLSLDAGNLNSFPGQPTSNLSYHQNPRLDSYYQPYMPESASGTIAANHPGAIRVYNSNGSDISYYLNTGISVANSGIAWEFTRHAYWIYDNTLKKPVVEMYDTNSVWKAKYFSLGTGSWSSNGWGVGTKYTISWLQWTTDIAKAAYVGMYTRNTAGTYNFWDGLSFGYNTEVNKWERVSATFTVTSSWDQTIDYNSIYMYGMYGPVPNTLRIADVQVEIKDAATNFSETLTRGTSVATNGGWRDISGNNNHGTLVDNPSFNSSNAGSIVFNGSNYVSAVSVNANNSITLEAFIYPTSYPSGGGGGGFIISNLGYYLELANSGVLRSYFYGLSSAGYHNGTVTIPLNTWRHVAVVRNTSDNTIRHYVNGVLDNTISSVTGTTNNGSQTLIGAYTSGGYGFVGRIANVKVYNRALSSTELSENFNATRSRFGV
jgi:hypothetical protein